MSCGGGNGNNNEGSTPAKLTTPSVVLTDDIDVIKSYYNDKLSIILISTFINKDNTLSNDLVDELSKLNVRGIETKYTINDIDDKSLESFYNYAIKANRLEMDVYNKKDLLIMLGLLEGERLNNAGYSLFGKNTKIPLKLAIYATNEKITFIDLQVKNGNIYRLLNEAINYIHSNIHWKVEIGSRKRTEIPEIPIKAIREIVINSFAHARYKAETEHEINIFPGRVTIYNPGSFPDNLTPLDFVNSNRSSIKRNKIIFDVLFRSKEVEKSGSGFKRVYDLCKQENIKCEFKTDIYGFSFSFIRNNSNKFNILTIFIFF